MPPSSRPQASLFFRCAESDEEEDFLMTSRRRPAKGAQAPPVQAPPPQRRKRKWNPTSSSSHAAISEKDENDGEYEEEEESADVTSSDADDEDESDEPEDEVELTRHLKRSSKRKPKLEDVKPKIERASRAAAKGKSRAAATMQTPKPKALFRSQKTKASPAASTSSSSKGKTKSSLKTSSTKSPKAKSLAVRNQMSSPEASSSPTAEPAPNNVQSSEEDMLTASEGTLASSSEDERDGMGRWTRDDQRDWIKKSYMLSDNETSDYNVEKIIRHRMHKRHGHIEYRTKWKDYMDLSNTWEPRCNFEGSPFVKDYWKKVLESGGERPIEYKKKGKPGRDSCDTDEEVLCNDATIRRAARKRKRYDIRKDRHLLRQRFRLPKRPTFEKVASSSALLAIEKVASSSAIQPPNLNKRPRISESEGSEVFDMASHPSNTAPLDKGSLPHAAPPMQGNGKGKERDTSSTLPVAPTTGAEARKELARLFLPVHPDKLKRDRREQRQATKAQSQKDGRTASPVDARAPSPEDARAPSHERTQAPSRDSSREASVECVSEAQVPPSGRAPGVHKFAGAHRNVQPKVKMRPITSVNILDRFPAPKKPRQTFTGKRPLSEAASQKIASPTAEPMQNARASSSRQVSWFDEQPNDVHQQAGGNQQAEGSHQTKTSASHVFDVHLQANSADDAWDTGVCSEPLPIENANTQAADDACGWDAEDDVPLQIAANVGSVAHSAVDDTFATGQHHTAPQEDRYAHAFRGVTSDVSPATFLPSEMNDRQPSSSAVGGDEGWLADYTQNDDWNGHEAASSASHGGSKLSVHVTQPTSPATQPPDTRHASHPVLVNPRDGDRFSERGERWRSNPGNPNVVSLPPRGDQRPRFHSATRNDGTSNESGAHRWTANYAGHDSSMPPPRRYSDYHTRDVASAPSGARPPETSAAGAEADHSSPEWFADVTSDAQMQQPNDGGRDDEGWGTPEPPSAGAAKPAREFSSLPRPNDGGRDDEGWGTPEPPSAEAGEPARELYSLPHKNDCDAYTRPTASSPPFYPNLSLQQRRSEGHRMHQDEAGPSGRQGARWSAESDRGGNNAFSREGADFRSNGGGGYRQSRPLPDQLDVRNQAFAKQQTLSMGDSGVDLVGLATPRGRSNFTPSTPTHPTPPLSRGEASSPHESRSSASRERSLDAHAHRQGEPSTATTLLKERWKIPLDLHKSIGQLYHIVLYDPALDADFRNLRRYCVDEEGGGWKTEISDKMRGARSNTMIWLPRLSWPFDDMLREAVTHANFRFMLYHRGRVEEVWMPGSPCVVVYSFGALIKKLLARCSMGDDADDAESKGAWQHTSLEHEEVMLHPMQLTLVQYLIKTERVKEFFHMVLHVPRAHNADDDAFRLVDKATEALAELPVVGEEGEVHNDLPWQAEDADFTALDKFTAVVDTQVHATLSEMQATMTHCRRFTMVMHKCTLRTKDIRTSYDILRDDATPK